MLQFFAGLSGLFPWGEDHWRHTQWAGMLLLAFAFISSLNIESRLIKIAVGVFTTQALWIAFFGHPDFPELRFQLGTVASHGLLLLLLFLWALQRPEAYEKSELIPWLGFVDAVYMVYNRFAIGPYVGMMNNDSMDAAFVAICIPLIGLFSRPQSKRAMIATGFMGLVVLLSGSSTGAIILGVVTLFTAYKTLGVSTKLSKLIIASWAVLIPALLYKLLGEQLLNPNGRVNAWAGMLGFFQEQPWPTLLFGTGIGTFEWLYPTHQMAMGMRKTLFLWAHNEFIQVLFEHGIIGLSFLVVLVVKMLRLFRNHDSVFAAAIGMVIAMGTQAPFRYFPFQMLVFFFCADYLARAHAWRTAHELQLQRKKSGNIANAVRG